MKKTLLILLLSLSAGFSAAAQELIAYRDSVKGAYPFLLYVPGSYSDTASVKKPLIVFLHGKSRCGRDLSMVTRIDGVASSRNGEKYI